MDNTLKGTVESIVIAFILAFVFRAFIVEAFVIPTGSMAPTLLGKHISVTCPQCGYSFTVRPPKQPGAVAVCPLDNSPIPFKSGSQAVSGDRIMVNKFVYDFTSPKRWDVIVFKYPNGPRINYIKRLVGLPGESLYIFDGNLYVKEKDSSQWHIARKTTRPDVQNAVWQPIYLSQYIPLDGGYNRSRRIFNWSTPWVASSNQSSWEITDRRSYRYNSAKASKINFSFKRSGDDNALTEYPYNEMVGPHDSEPIEDIKLSAAFTPDKPGLGVKMTTTARLDHIHLPPVPITAHISANGRISLFSVNPDTGKVRHLASTTGYQFPPKTTTKVQFWFVDQQASVWINGQRVLKWGFQIPIKQLKRRPPPAMRPDVSISVSGSPVTLHKVDLWRDLYYTTLGGPRKARGGLVRGINGVAGGKPVVLGKNQYFCMGDNSPISDDGRYWKGVNPWIQKKDFAGKFRPGIVPGRLIVGKAFFVYWPAPFHLFGLDIGLVPNFDDMRFIH